jgi:3-phenylpropionate/cinnamic acid dioxygenase small subunit
MIEDQLAIERLIATYAALVDAGDFEGLAELLADAVIGTVGDDAGVSGRDSIAEMFASTVRLYEDGTPRTRHVTTNVIVDVDDQAATAEARSYFTVVQATGEFPLQPVVAGTYRDRFEVRDAGWRFVERRFSVDLVGDVSRHMLPGAEKLLVKAPDTQTRPLLK